MYDKSFGMNFSASSNLGSELLMKIISNKKIPNTIININFPPVDQSEVKGTKFVELDSHKLSDNIEYESNSSNFRIGAMITKDHQIKGSDLYYLKKGYISVTPLALNVTDYSSLHKMREILEWRIMVRNKKLTLLWNLEIVLEIGTGSGYQASILSLLCRRVYTIERIETLHHFSNQKFKELSLSNITAKHENGSNGWPEASPFDRIILTCAIKEIPKQLFLQLKVGGILIGPEILDNKDQVLNMYTHIEKNKFEKKSVEDVKFVPML